MPDSSIVVLDRGNNTTCTINLLGATVVSWRVKNEEKLFVSEEAVFDGKTAIRGGVSLAFPHIGPWNFGPNYGFTKIALWTVEKTPERLVNGDVEVTFSIVDNDFTRSMWNYQFMLTYHLILREKELDFNVAVDNRSNHLTFSFNILLDSYLRVPNVELCQIAGLHGVRVSRENGVYQEEHGAAVTLSGGRGRLYQRTPQEHILIDELTCQKISIQKFNFPDTIIWNPLIDQAQDMNDFCHDDYTNFVCVETGCVSFPVALHPGNSFEACKILKMV